MFCCPHHLWGQVLGCPPALLGQGSLPACSLSLPLTPLTPSCLLSLPSHFLSLPLTPNGQCRVGVCYTMFWDPHHLCGGKGQERARSEGSARGVRGVRGSKGSEMNVILGFKAPTTSGRKTLVMTYSAYVSPPPGSTVPTQCPFT